VLRTLLAAPEERPDLADADLRRSLVAGLADENPTIRFSSAWAVRLLAGEQPNAVPGLVGYLAANRDASDDVRSVLAHLDASYPDLVRPVLDERDIDHDELTAAVDAGPVVPATDGTALVPATSLEAIRSVVETEGEVPTVIEREMDDPTETDRGDGADRKPRLGAGDTATETDAGTTATETAADAGSGGADDGRTDARHTGGTGRTRPRTVHQQKRADIEAIESSPLFRAIRRQCRFDDLEVVLPRDGRRYADTIRARAITGREERGTALRLLDRPDADDDTEAPADFGDAVAESLARWQGAGATDGVVTVHDWACEPRPWLATEPVEETIAEWTPPSVAARLRCGVQLAESVANCHRQGVVHAGLDPGNVVMPADALTERRRPLLDNVGLMFALREHFSLPEYLDPRYVAPEYLDESYGSIDHSTDIYQLGTVLYRLFTDRPPFDGDGDAVRDAVLSADPPAPSERNAELPDPVDEVVRKAISKRKLVRYETASQLRVDLRHACAQAGYEVT
jgi:hypothetical protein